VGDPDLAEEASLGLDLSLRKRAGRVTGELNLFANRFDDYIYEVDTGMTEPPLDPDGLPVFRVVQSDAEFRGAELSALVHLFHTDPHELDLELRADWVRAELRASGDPLPRIPPLRLSTGLSYAGDRWHADAEVIYTAEQDRVADFETVTDSYTFLNAGVGYRIYGGRLVHHLLLRGTNLTDQEARNHPSRLKQLIPLPGRDVSLSYRLIF
jgi:iron complex outermembrane receptor protein